MLNKLVPAITLGTWVCFVKMKMGEWKSREETKKKGEVWVEDPWVDGNGCGVKVLEAINKSYSYRYSNIQSISLFLCNVHFCETKREGAECEVRWSGVSIFSPFVLFCCFHVSSEFTHTPPFSSFPCLKFCLNFHFKLGTSHPQFICLGNKERG